jgi:hypothetical protein
MASQEGLSATELVGWYITLNFKKKSTECFPSKTKGGKN